VLTGQEAGWASELVWTQRLEEKSFAPAGDRIPVVQSVARHYIDISDKYQPTGEKYNAPD